MSESSYQQQFMQYPQPSSNNQPQLPYPNPMFYPPQQLPQLQQSQQLPYYPQPDQQIGSQQPMFQQPPYQQNYENQNGYYYPSPQNNMQQSMYQQGNYPQQVQGMQGFQNYPQNNQMFMQDQTCMYSQQFSQQPPAPAGSIIHSRLDSQQQRNELEVQEDGELSELREKILWKKQLRDISCSNSSSSSKGKSNRSSMVLHNQTNHRKKDHDLKRKSQSLLDNYQDLFPGKPLSVLLREYCQKLRFEFEIECVESENGGFLGFVVIESVKSQKQPGKSKKEAKESAAYEYLLERSETDEGLRSFIESAVEKELKIKKKFQQTEKGKSSFNLGQHVGEIPADENSNCSYDNAINYRDQVGDLVQNDLKTGVNYEVKGEQNTWEALCIVGSLVTKGRGTSKKDAKNQAAFSMLLNLKKANQKTLQKIIKKAVVKQKIIQTSEKLKELESLKQKISIQTEEEKKNLEQQEEEDLRMQAKIEADVEAKQTKGQYSCPIDLSLSSKQLFEIKDRSKIQFINSHLKSYARRQLVEEKDYVQLREMYEKLIDNKGKFNSSNISNNSSWSNDFILIDFAIVGSHELKLLRKNSLVIDVVMCYQKKEILNGEESKKHSPRKKNSISNSNSSCQCEINNCEQDSKSLKDNKSISSSSVNHNFNKSASYDNNNNGNCISQSNNKNNNIQSTAIQDSCYCNGNNSINEVNGYLNTDIVSSTLPIITQIFQDHQIIRIEQDRENSSNRNNNTGKNSNNTSSILIKSNNSDLSMRIFFDDLVKGCYGSAIHSVLWMINFKNIIINLEQPCNRVLSMFRSWKRANKELDELDIAVIDIAVYSAGNRFSDCSGDCVVRTFELLSSGILNDIAKNGSLGEESEEGDYQSNGMKNLNKNNSRNLEIPNLHREILAKTPIELLDKLQQAAFKVYINNDYNFIKTL